MARFNRRQFLCQLLTLVGGSWIVSACNPRRGLLPGESQAARNTATPRPTYTPAATGTPGVTTTATTTTAPSPSPTKYPSPTAQTQFSPTPGTAPTATPLPASYTPVPATPTLPPSPTATPALAPSRANLTAHWPQTETSRVVVVRHGGVWAGDNPDPAIVLEMLDVGLGSLAGGVDPQVVWRTLFDTRERVLLKVNCISAGGPTQPAVAYAVAQRLQDAGLAAENILIFDRTDGELSGAGYKLNDGGAGVQCHGSRGEGAEAALTQAGVRFFRELDEADGIINIPTPKGHGIAGVSVSLKNHYGSINHPGALHGGGCDPALPELNAQPNVLDKTRLIVGAALNVSPFGWNSPERENALLLSFDPVALDTVARDVLVRHHQAQGTDGGALVNGSHYLATAQEIGLGANQPELIDLQEVTLA